MEPLAKIFPTYLNVAQFLLIPTQTHALISSPQGTWKGRKVDVI